jgi:hypothetical protein
LTASTVAIAQDEFEDEESSSLKAPKRTVVVDNNPTINVQGVVVDDATK